MHILITIACFAWAVSGATANALVYRHQPDQKLPGVKVPGSMTFRELKRDKRTSTIRIWVRGTGRPAMGEAMFAMRGFYDIAKERRSRYLIPLHESAQKDGSVIWVVGFSDSKSVNPQKYFGLRRPPQTPDGVLHKFHAIERLDLIFKGPQP